MLPWLWLVITLACTSPSDLAQPRETSLEPRADAGSPRPRGRVDAGVVASDGAPAPSHDAARQRDGAAARDAAEPGDAARSADDEPTPDASPAAAPDGGDDAQPVPDWDLCAQLAQRAGVPFVAGPVVSWASLLCETVDLDRLTRPPAHAYKELLASSHDRSSQLDGQPGWYANADFGWYLRTVGDEHVMMEDFGPGVIVRLWSADPTGRIRIYLDDPVTPAIDAPMSDFLSGRYTTPWGDPFVFVAAEGFNAYFPLPYSTYARVSTTSKDNLYYQVDYRDYDPRTKVEPYSPSGLQALAPLAKAIQTLLADPSADPLYAALPTLSLSLGAEQPERHVPLGPVVIRELVVSGFDASKDKLRSTRLIFTVDGERTIDAPLGDLFGAGPGLWPFASLAATMTSSALTLRWPMPVRGDLTVRLESSAGPLDDLTVKLRYSDGVPNKPRLFHALWTGVQTFSTATAQDWTVLDYQGEGWYVGTVLNINNPTNFWWGEGDEKISIDGEPFPSHFGTGTEDYFGLAWCSTELASRPWIGQTRADGPGNAGRSSMYRWHVGDAIPFSERLRFRLEVLSWLDNDTPLPFTEDAVAYWYATPGGAVSATPLDIANFQVVQVASSVFPGLPGPSLCRF